MRDLVSSVDSLHTILLFTFSVYLGELYWVFTALFTVICLSSHPLSLFEYYYFHDAITSTESNSQIFT